MQFWIKCLTTYHSLRRKTRILTPVPKFRQANVRPTKISKSAISITSLGVNLNRLLAKEISQLFPIPAESKKVTIFLKLIQHKRIPSDKTGWIFVISQITRMISQFTWIRSTLFLKILRNLMNHLWAWHHKLNNFLSGKTGFFGNKRIKQKKRKLQRRKGRGQKTL